MSTSKLLAAATACALAALALVGTPERVSAAQDGAVVFHGGTCTFAYGGFPLVVTTDAHSVITPSGNASLVCRGEIPASAAPSSAVTIDIAGRCRIGSPKGPITGNDGSVTYTPSGNAILRCQYKK